MIIAASALALAAPAGIYIARGRMLWTPKSTSVDGAVRTSPAIALTMSAPTSEVGMVSALAERHRGCLPSSMRPHRRAIERPFQAHPADSLVRPLRQLDSRSSKANHRAPSLPRRPRHPLLNQTCFSEFIRFMIRPNAICLCVSLAATVSLGTPSVVMADEPHSAADIAQGREFLHEAFVLREKEMRPERSRGSRRPHALAGTPISGIELGRAYVAVGRLIEARETFLSVGRITRRTEETAKSAAARTESAQLASDLSPAFLDSR